MSPLPALLLLLAAAPDRAPANLVLADLGLHVIGVGYQRSLAPWLAAQVDAESYTPWTQNIDLLGLSGEAYRADTTGVVGRVRAFVYPRGEAPTGFWLSPFAQAGPGWATRSGQRVTGLLWAAGASAGYAVLLGGAVHLALGVGVQYHAARFGGVEAPSFGRPYPTLDGSVGYAF